MANYSIWSLGESQLTISGGAQLDGVTQGDGSHLVGQTITMNSYNFEEILVRDRRSDINFDDNDGDQRLRGSQTFDGVNYGNNTIIEAEYRLILRDPNTGETYEALAINFNNSSPSYGTVEGLSFVDVIPPAGVALEVIAAFEGPGSSGQPPIQNGDIAVPACFTPGTFIDTPDGPRPVEELRAGDWVMTLDRGAQPLIWVGQTAFGAEALARNPDARPILIRRDAFGPGMPCQDMRVSPQHRVLISGSRAELLFGEYEVLAAAAHLVDGQRVLVDDQTRKALYIHLQCAAHEVLVSDGLPSESYNPGTQTIVSFSQKARAQLEARLPTHLGGAGPVLTAARPMIKRHEAALWQIAA
ncbi:Hint domain-containing protein [Aestuariivita boseongensis]|uniref:Hint domain-containing protein n=1 Tax=Aestuariivita boseongensis TaxID=1470562 RepID=UPI000680230A|nr:Hint domain-containing protein [Aestuariivita boseongensis]